MTTPTVFVLHRCAIRHGEYTAHGQLYVSDADAVYGAVPMRVFHSLAEAEAEAERLEREARRTTPIGPVLSPYALENVQLVEKAALAAGLPAPDFGQVGPPVQPLRTGGCVSFGSDYFEWIRRIENALRAWWASVVSQATPEINAILWDELFPEARFFVVRPVPLGD